MGIKKNTFLKNLWFRDFLFPKQSVYRYFAVLPQLDRWELKNNRDLKQVTK